MGRQACKVGVDEAGRGPVLGPMVYGAVAIAEEAEAELRNSSYNDSKKLSEKERESLRNDIDVDERLTCSTVSVPAERISESMLRYGSKGSLNDIAFDATVDCVRQLITLGIHVSSILTDAVGDTDKWRNALEDAFPSTHVTVEKKADANYPLVSAASILAKTTRDRELQSACEQSEISPGSGYPGDPQTQEWLSAHFHRIFGFTSRHVRFSWSTCKRYLENCCINVRWQSDVSPSQAGQTTLPTKHGRDGTWITPHKRHAFFNTRSLQRATDEDW